MNFRHTALCLVVLSLLVSPLPAQRAVPPYDLWNSQVLADIRNQNSLELTVSNPSPSFFATSYEVHTGTRNQSYNGSDPLNSISNVDTDSTAITFIDYFGTIRYATRQYAPVLTVIGTHDGYFPLPDANLMEQAITSSGAQPNFEKRLWLLPNAIP